MTPTRLAFIACVGLCAGQLGAALSEILTAIHAAPLAALLAQIDALAAGALLVIETLPPSATRGPRSRLGSDTTDLRGSARRSPAAKPGRPNGEEKP